MQTTIHLLNTVHNDTVTLISNDTDSVSIHGAERSMGSKWRDGQYTSKQARLLWQQIIEEGGKQIDVGNLNTVVAALITNKTAAYQMAIKLMENNLKQEQESRNREREHAAEREEQLVKEMHDLELLLQQTMDRAYLAETQCALLTGTTTHTYHGEEKYMDDAV
jgi:hypothetical protein